MGGLDAVEQSSQWILGHRATRGRAAFTLFELAAVLVLVAIAASLVAVSLKAPYQQARLGEMLEQCEQFDGFVRRHAARFGRPAQIQLDLAAGVLTAHESEPTNQAPARRSLVLAGGVRIDRVLLPNRRIDYGQAMVAVDAQGQTPTYALRLTGAGGTRWLLFAGLTGQVTMWERDADVQPLFAELAPVAAERRLDPH